MDSFIRGGFVICLFCSEGEGWDDGREKTL